MNTFTKRPKSGGFDSSIKSKKNSNQKQTSIPMNRQLRIRISRKKRKKRKVTEKHDLDDDSDKELDQLMSKYCTGSEKMGNKTSFHLTLLISSHFIVFTAHSN
jgi:hypothetical protein